MKSILLRVLVIMLTALPGGVAIAADPGVPIGLLSKVILDVTWKESSKQWEKASRGQMLATGDMVRTGPSSLAIIKFKDNSLVHLRERSELTVTGTTKSGSFSKAVEIQTGVVGFNVAKQRAGEEFRFTSPTSVASIRGTSGALNATSTADTLVVIEGTIKLTNKKSSRALDVGAGFTGISTPNGSLISRASTPQERKMAADALLDGQTKKLELELRNPQGKTSRLRIDYKD
jgi:hypothetical protein